MEALRFLFPAYQRNNLAELFSLVTPVCEGIIKMNWRKCTDWI